jgi:hypothetical protein
VLKGTDPLPLFPEFPYDLLVAVALPKLKAFWMRPMAQETANDRRVIFEHPLPAHMMAIDGTWRRACTIRDVSGTGATLLVESSIEGLALKEFFLLLSSTGLAYRRCQLDRVNGEELAVNFLVLKNKTKAKARPETV